MHETTLTTADAQHLHLRVWMPIAAPHAVLLIVHGLGEHAGRYPHVVETFLTAGYAIYGHDHRGFGRSSGKRGDYDHFDQILADLDQVVELARSQHPGLPLCLYAHSLGGLIATHYLARHETKIAAAVISAPGYGAGPDLNAAKIQLAKIMARILPGFSMNTGGSKDFRLSHDAEVQRAYESDTLRHDIVTMRFVHMTLQKAEEGKAVLATLRLPILVMLGEEDTSINRQAVHDAVAQAGPTVTFRRYPGGYHEVHNEIAAIRQPALAGVLAWMEAQLHGD
ncbi:MAG: lysophospholipase [Caldilineales bacterium]|nr:lysophospholipase [Caldilineales bacterium]